MSARSSTYPIERTGGRAPSRSIWNRRYELVKQEERMVDGRRILLPFDDEEGEAADGGDADGEAANERADGIPSLASGSSPRPIANARSCRPRISPVPHAPRGFPHRGAARRLRHCRLREPFRRSGANRTRWRSRARSSLRCVRRRRVRGSALLSRAQLTLAQAPVRQIEKLSSRGRTGS